MWYFHSFKERTTSIFDLVDQFMDEGAKEKFRFAYQIQMNQIYLREALINNSFHRELFFRQDVMTTTDYVMGVALNILRGVFDSELDEGAIPIDNICCRNSAPEQKVRFYEVLFRNVFMELCLLMKQPFLFVGTGLFLRMAPYRNNKTVLEVGYTKDPSKKSADNLALSKMKNKQLKDVKMVYKKVFQQKLIVISNDDEIFFRIEIY
jgi:hypothetical protein